MHGKHWRIVYQMPRHNRAALSAFLPLVAKNLPWITPKRVPRVDGKRLV